MANYLLRFNPFDNNAVAKGCMLNPRYMPECYPVCSSYIQTLTGDPSAVISSLGNMSPIRVRKNKKERWDMEKEGGTK